MSAPLIWNVRPSPSGENFRLRFLEAQREPTYDATPNGLVINLDMTREEAESLRDVLTAALSKKTFP